MTRTVHRFLPALAAWLLAGCAAAPIHAPSAAPDHLPAVAGHAGQAGGDPLIAARESYFAGVRAHVREDPDEARARFEECRAALDEGPIPVHARHDAEILDAKAEYFLKRLEGRVEETDDEVARPEPPPDWPLRYGAIVPADNEHVDRWIRYFLGDGRTAFQKWLDRKSLYQDVFDEIFAAHGLPQELTYHAMIESGYSTSAYSWAHAVGLWQFIRPTGRKYGLRSDWWVDERRDPARSTEAAARYLSELREEFGAWELALAAYNVGEYKVRRQIKRQGTRDFWKLKLPRETRNHVPKFFAAMILGKEAERHGFQVQQREHEATETIRVQYSVDFEVLGECLDGVPARKLAELNPALVRRATPPDEEGYPVVVPAGTAERGLAALAALPSEKRIRWAHHRVRGGDTLSEIATRYRTSVYAVAQANRMGNVHRLRVGQELLIPQGQRGAVPPPKFASSEGPTTSRKITYVVRRGDTLSEIADRHGTSVRRLRTWNRLGRYLHPGQRLTIYQGARSGKDTIVRVRKGDTLWDIARAQGLSLSSLLRANGLTKSSLIKPGDRIRVPRS